MGKGLMIEILKSQLEASNATVKALLSQIEQLNVAYNEQSNLISSLKETIGNLERLLQERDASVAAAKNQVKGLSKLVERKSEQQKSAVPIKTDEDMRIEAEERAAALKARGNNGAKRNMRYEMETIEQDVLPEELDSLEGCTLISERYAVRYEMIPMRFIKRVYRIIVVKKEGVVYSSKAPLAPLQNSSFDGSFIAGIAQLRYLYSMPVERIVAYFKENGFDIDKSTAHGLLKKTASLFENLHKAIHLAVKEDDYLICDETYHRVLDGSKDKGSMKGYIWAMLAKHLKLAYFFYEDGSRSQSVIMNEMKGYGGMIQSDGLRAYKTVEQQSGGRITRAACLQHCKRGFLDDDIKDNPDAKEIGRLCNELYQNEHQHRVGKDGWTIADNLKWRRKYSREILTELKARLKVIVKDERKYPPKSQMYKAASYMLNEWSGIEAIFTRGDVCLDTNDIERLNRYLSLSRKNSLFFGSHAGAERGCIFYSLACSCRLNGINFFEYLTDILNRSAAMPNGSKPETYRDLLPDRWKKGE